MPNVDMAGLTNKVLTFIICLMTGGIIGFMVGDTTPMAVDPANPGATAPANIDDVLGLENAWIVEGLSCPTPGCTNPLRSCTDPLAREVRGWVNAQLQAGRTGESITAEIISTHGANVFKLEGLTPK